MDFLPDNYETPATNSNYLKFATGETRFRIVSKPIIGWLDWKDNKPMRFPMNAKPEKPVNPAKPIRHFWAMIVWNYAMNSAQILEITQATIQKAIEKHSKDADWGAPFEYDFKVTKKGTTKDDTEYSVIATPKKSLPDDVIKTLLATKICLNELFTGNDPFKSTSAPTEIEVNPFQ